MNTILQKRIEEAAREVSDVCEPCDYGDPFCASCHRPYMYDAAKKMGEVILSNQWISVDEELPSQIEGEHVSKYVFVTNRDWSDVMRYEFNEKTWLDYANGSHCGITHWMEIPKLGCEK